jgi:lysine-specific permease
MSFWTDRVPDWACKFFFITKQKKVDLTVVIVGSGIWLIIIYVLNLFGARSYGEAEYWFSVVSSTFCQKIA